MPICWQQIHPWSMRSRRRRSPCGQRRSALIPYDSVRLNGTMQRTRWSARIQNIDSVVHDRARAAYLDGQSVDRGTLSIGNDALHFSGWHGSVSIPLKKILGIYGGTSRLSPRAGVPIVGRLFPGRPRAGDSLLLTVWGTDDTERSDTAQRKLVALADLEDGEGLASQIVARQSALNRLQADRVELAGELLEAQSAWREARSELASAQTEVAEVERELDQLRTQQKDAQQRPADQAENEDVRR